MIEAFDIAVPRRVDKSWLTHNALKIGCQDTIGNSAYQQSKQDIGYDYPHGPLPAKLSNQSGNGCDAWYVDHRDKSEDHHLQGAQNPAEVTRPSKFG